MYRKSLKNKEKIFAVAPMMDWTDRHCRNFHRLLSQHALLYTEMVVADAIIHGDRDYLIGCQKQEHPLALQVGGSDPHKLAQVAQIAVEYGYKEINLNVGCPSDRVQSGTFGACLMKEPELVARCVAEMKAKVDIPVTVKCRIGVDDQDPKPALDTLAQGVWKEGADALWVHARKAWLEGLSPKENREIPPLDYDRVYDLKLENMNRFIGLNGGVETLSQSLEVLNQVDGVMVGRAAYRSPMLLAEVDKAIYGSDKPPITMPDLCTAMMDYSEVHLTKGGKLHQITRHMLGLFQGIPGARSYRQILSVESVGANADPKVIEKAFNAVGALEMNGEEAVEVIV